MAAQTDYQWVSDPPDELLCVICLDVAKDPQQHGNSGCGKVFCKSCITRHQTTNQECPNCRQPLTVFGDDRSARNIRALKVKCNNLNNGCQWVGEPGGLETHLQSCDFTLLPCTNKCEENDQTVKVLRKDFQDHLTNKCPKRQYQCPLCKQTGDYKDITTVHLKTCQMVSVPCRNRQCTEILPRRLISYHHSICEYEPVSCKYARVGCTEKPIRKEIKHHEQDDQLHLRITTTSNLELKCEVTKLKKRLESLEAKVPHTFKFTGFMEYKEKNNSYHSQPFYTYPCGYRMNINIFANGKGKGAHVSVYVCLQKGDNDDSLTWPFTGTVTIELLNQVEDKSHHKVDVKFRDNECSQRVLNDCLNEKGWGVSKFIPHNKLVQPDKNCQYLKDDSLIFRVSVQVPDHKPWLECSKN